MGDEKTEKEAWRAWSLAPGFIVAIRLRPGAAPARCYVGQVRTADDFGTRITLVDWLAGAFVKQDMFIPWASIETAFVATPDDQLADGELGQWQEYLGREYQPDEPETPRRGPTGSMGETRIAIVAYLGDNPGATPKQVADGAQLDYDLVKKTLTRMVADGQAETGARGRYYLPGARDDL